MHASLRMTSLLLAISLLAVGCAIPPVPGGPLSEIGDAVATDQPAGDSSTPESISGAPDKPGQPPASQDPMDLLLAELEAIEDLDSQTVADLMGDLRSVEPSQRPKMVRQYRAALAFRQRQAERETRQAGESQPATPPAATTSTRLTSPTAMQTAATTSPGPSPIHDAAINLSNPVRQPDLNPGVANHIAASASQAILHTAASQSPSGALAALVVDPQVTQAVLTIPASGVAGQRDWHHDLGAAITALEQQTRDAPRTVDEVGQHARLRMLYLAGGRRDDAMRPIAGISPAQQDYWSEQLFGLATYLGNDRMPDAGHRAAEAKRHLTNAVDRLGELGNLSVRNLALCTDVWGFGSYKEFDTLDFAPGERVLVYAEVDNYRSESTEKGYHTSLRVSYEILDSRGQRVDRIEPPKIEDYCASRRRDFHIRHFVDMPKRIYNGPHTLLLTVEDVKGQKIGQSSIEFTVKEEAGN